MNKKKLFLKRLDRLLMITIGCFIYAASMSLFLDKANLAPGGINGIAVMLNRIIPFDTGTIIILLNIPILIWGLIKLGFKLIVVTIYATVLSSLFMNALAPFGPVSDDTIVNVVLGSILMGVGVGLVFRAGATTGGMDIIVKIIRRRFPYIKSSVIFLTLDVIVVIAAGFFFDDIKLAVLAGIVVFMYSKIMDFILYGPDEAKLIYVISEKPDEITARVLKELDIGVTFLNGIGAYTGTNKKVIMCAAHKRDSSDVIDIVKEEDPDAFLIVTSASEIFGEGYKSIKAERL